MKNPLRPKIRKRAIAAAAVTFLAAISFLFFSAGPGDLEFSVAPESRVVSTGNGGTDSRSSGDLSPSGLPSAAVSRQAQPTHDPALAAVGPEVMKSIHEQIREAQYFFTPAYLASGRAGFRAPNPAQRLDIAIGVDGLGLAAEIEPGRHVPGGLRPEPDWTLHMGLAEGAQDTSVSANDTRVEIRHATLGVTEWYQNRPDGLEQGFTVERSRQRDGELRVSLKVETSLRLLQAPGQANEISFVDAQGQGQLQYRKLHVYDAKGRDLPSDMEIAKADDGSFRLDLVADARGAAYPVTIDPLITRTSTILTGFDGAPLDQNGLSVGVSQTHLAIGARNHSNAEGAVYLFRRNTDGSWAFQQKVQPLDSLDGRRFGSALSLTADRLVVGAPEDPPGAPFPVGPIGPGAVYIFEPNASGTWVQLQKLTPLAASAGDAFGLSVADGGDTIVIGAPRDDVGLAANQGTAYVFTRPPGSSDPFTQLIVLSLATPDDQALFGLSLVLDDDILLVGTPGRNGGEGVAIAFHRNEGGPDLWGQVGQISAETPVAGDAFGTSLALFPVWLGSEEASVPVVGAPGRDGGRGAVEIVFPERIELKLPDGQPNDLFGFSLASNEHFLAVGVPQREVGGVNNSGMIAMYASQLYAGFAEVDRIFPAGLDAGSQFGFSVALDGGLLAGGAPFYDSMGDNDRGAALAFDLDGGTWAQCGGLARADDVDRNDSFGVSIAVDRGVMVVGAPKDRDPAGGATTGAVYVFYRSGSGDNSWFLVERLVPGITGALFGQSVDVSGDTIAVGAPGVASVGLPGSGAVYLYKRNHGGADEWDQIWVKNSTPAEAGAAFGAKVSLCDDHLAAGAPDEDSPEIDRGAAYVFHRNQGAPEFWGQVARLTGSFGGAGDRFGSAISCNGHTVVVGAPFYEEVDGGTSFPETGAVYIFNRNSPSTGTWGEVTNLEIPGEIFPGTRLQFGRAVSLDGPTVAVSTRGRGICLYRRNAGGADMPGLVAITAPLNGPPPNNFGSEIVLCGEKLAANGSDANGFNGIFIFHRNLGGADTWGQAAQFGSNRGDHFTGGLGFDGAFVAGPVEHSLGTFSFAGVFHHQPSFHSIPEIPLTTESGMSDTQNGKSVDLTDDFLIAGAPTENGGRGAAYVFKRNDGGANWWGRVAKLTDPSSLPLNFFGNSVGISSESAAVGEPFADSPGGNSGLIRVYERNEGGADNWGFQTQLVASDAVVGEQFGTSVDIDGDQIIAGAVRAGNVAILPGQAYLFERNFGGSSWGERAILTAPVGPLSNFGYSVALSGDTAIAGAVNQSPDGGAYIFERNEGGSDNWGRVADLVIPPLGGGAAAGWSVAIDGPIAAVGAPLYGLAEDYGSVLVYEKNQTGADAWGFRKMITTNALDGENLGSGVAVRGDRIAAGAPGYDSGRAYLFERHIGGSNSWGQMGRLLPTDFPAGGLIPPEPSSEGYVVRELESFGWSVAMSDSFIVVGAPRSSIVNYSGGAFGTDRDNAGAVFVYQTVSHFRYWLLNRRLLGDLSERAYGTAYYLWRDQDRDGLSEIMEYLMALDPRNPDVGEAVMAVSFDASAGPFGQLVLRYRRAKYAPDGELVVKWSADLEHWQRNEEAPPIPGGTPRAITEEIVGDLGEAVLVEARLYLTVADEQIFLRLDGENIRAY